MPIPTDASDDELVAHVAAGDHGALDQLWGRHADAVHDHLARWTLDAELAAASTVAAFTTLLEDVVAGTAPSAVRPSLLRTARSHAAQVLAAGDHEGPPIPAATLAASGVASTTPEDAAAAWSAAAALDPPSFSVLDCSVRQGSSVRDLSAILGQPEATVQELLDTVHDRIDPATRTAYAALAPVPAPVAARTAVTQAATTRIGTPALLPRTVRLRALGALGAVAVLVLGIGLANAFNGTTATPTSGPATVAAEPVPSPSPEVDPSPTPTLEPLGAPSEVPMASPEPTVPPPSPAPTAEPTPTAAPQPTVLTVTIDDPPSGAVFAATTQDEQGRPAAAVPVVATVSGASESAAIAWTSGLEPDRTLLTTAEGELLLWLPDPCTNADHTVTVTVTDPADDRTAAASITVELRETCEDPPEVLIDQPTEDQTFQASPPDGSGSRRVSVPVRATSEGTDLEWAWSIDRGTLLAAPDGPEGTVEFTLDDCTLEQSVVLHVDVTRPADQATAEDDVTIRVNCGPIG